MMFKRGAPIYATEINHEQGEEVIYINTLGAPIVPSIAENGSIMERVVDLLAENPGASRVVFVQQRNYNYPSNQITLLSEISRIYNYLVKQEELLSQRKLSLFGNNPEIREDIQYLLNLLKQDPLSCFLELKKRIKEFRNQLENPNIQNRSFVLNYTRTLEKILELLQNTKLLKYFSTNESEFSLTKRDLYKGLFRAETLPNFTFTRITSQIPQKAELVDQYELKNDMEKVTVTILKLENDPKYFYHILPPEYSLSEDHHLLLNTARNVLAEHRPKAEEFIDPERTRQVFFNIAKDMLTELSKNKNIGLTNKELTNLAKILVRHTIGFGIIEVLLMDEKLQDIVLNAPITQNPIFVKHEKYEECVTNIIPSFEDINSWAAKLRLKSGRPLDEANPVLDTDLIFDKIRTRVAAVTEPLSPLGLTYAFRRHRDQPWTLPLFINNKMMNSFTAGFLSFIIDGARTLLVAGTRSSGKTSLLGALMLEIMPKYRTIVIEDTLELPTDVLRKLGYDILSMRVRSALVSGTTEVDASEGIKASLRLGDSALIVGEVRSDETRALYEAMRVGALANVVAGTIHGDSPYGVFDRVVNDLNVPVTSFKATDLILVANPIKTTDGLKSIKRLIEITEVRKHWSKDPLEEKGFVDLFKYNVEKDELEPTEELINGDSEIIKNIASKVKGWAGNWDAVYDNIILRGKIKQEIVDAAIKLNKSYLMEAPFNVISNAAFHRISEEVRKESALPWSHLVLPRWKNWFHKNIDLF
ncbi:MAG: type II/IV secretion system ATPase subunit [Nanoarchaeota archaeon]